MRGAGHWSGFLVIILALGLTGCATAPSTRLGRSDAAKEAITWSVGPCFGFCPVYSVSITRDGTVTFEGERHTALLGRHVRQDRAQAFRTTSAQLASFKPASDGAVQTPCDRRTSDQPVTHIIWTSRDGATTSIDYDRGCRSEHNDALGAVLQSLPAQLGIDGWSKQLTRPGASRG